MVEDFLDAIPEHLRPFPTAKLSSALFEAEARGWNASHLATTVLAEIRNPRATPGLVVDLAVAFSTRPPNDYVNVTPTQDLVNLSSPPSPRIAPNGGMPNLLLDPPVMETQGRKLS